MKEYTTACPRNCYSTCGFRVLVENNQIIRILPDSSNMATPEGPCIKGLSYLERHNSASRLTKPLVKTASKTFKEIGFNEAIAIAGNTISSISEKYSPKSIFYYTGSGMSGLTNEIGYSFWSHLGGVTNAYGNFCWPAGLEAVRLAMGDIKQNVPWDLENAALIIIWEKNPAETNIQETVFIDRAIEKGATVVVIDPRRTPTSDKADLLLNIRPGTDGALALAIAKIIIDNNLVNNEFINKHVSGFDKFRSSLSITAKEAEKITGIPSDQIERLAHMIGNIKPMTIIPGFGMQRFTNGGQSIRCLLSLSILTGNIGLPGAGFNYANMQGYVFDKVKEPLSYYPHINPDNKFRRKISMATLGKDMLTISDPELKMAWIERGNPVTQAPDSNLVKKALDKLDFVVVVDQFMNDTAEMADLILPAKTMFEQQDIISSYWSPYVQLKPKVLDPPDEVKPESEIYYHLAKNLKFNAGDEIPEPGDKNLENWLSRRIEGLSELSLEDFRSGPVLAPGLQEIAYSDYNFTTPSGKIELFSSEAASLWKTDELPSFKRAFKDEPGKKHKYILLSPNTKNWIHSQFGNMDVIKLNTNSPCLQISVEDAKHEGIKSGDIIRVYNDRGETQLEADVTNRISKGCVAFPNGWWIKDGGGGNLLSYGRETDIGYGTAFHDTLVSIEKQIQ